MRDTPCFYRSIFENVVLNVTIVLCAVFGFFNFKRRIKTAFNINFD